MNIGVAKVSLRIPENMSLKGKRQVVKSIIGRVKGKFDVAVAEVDDNDAWQLATIGICAISNNKGTATKSFRKWSILSTAATSTRKSSTTLSK